jgi:hypothetical protein
MVGTKVILAPIKQLLIGTWLGNGNFIDEKSIRILVTVENR